VPLDLIAMGRVGRFVLCLSLLLVAGVAAGLGEPQTCSQAQGCVELESQHRPFQKKLGSALFQSQHYLARQQLHEELPDAGESAITSAASLEGPGEGVESTADPSEEDPAFLHWMEEEKKEKAENRELAPDSASESGPPEGSALFQSQPAREQLLEEQPEEGESTIPSAANSEEGPEEGVESTISSAEDSEDDAGAEGSDDDPAFLRWMKEEEEDEAENRELAKVYANESGPPQGSENEKASSLIQDGSEWAWYQKTPGCHCDVVNRRRNERARFNHNDEHYYFIATNLGNRRRASIQGCHCEHERTLGTGWYCPAVWWTGGRGNCYCRSNYRQQGSKCLLRCRDQLGKVRGRWMYLQQVVGTSSISRTVGTSSSRSDTTSQSWSRTLTQGFEQSASVGFEVEGVSASSTMTVDRSVGQTWGRQSSTTISTVRSSSTTRTWSTDGISQGAHVWQWLLLSYNKCGEFVAYTYTNHKAVTASKARGPCCMPGMERPNGCEVGGSMYSKSRTPAHCGGHTVCHDRFQGCPRWRWHCTNGRWQFWMKDNCKKTCRTC